jgi:hypothetical protein
MNEKSIEKNPSKKVNQRNSRCYNLSIPAQNVKILIVHKQTIFVFNSFFYKKTQTPKNSFQKLRGGPCFQNQRMSMLICS